MDCVGPRLAGAATLICLLLIGTFEATPADASVIAVDQKVVEIDGNDYSTLDLLVHMTFSASPDILTVILTNTSGITTGPTALANAGNILTGLGFSLPDGAGILDTSSVSDFGSTRINTSTFTQDDWGYSNSARGHFADPGVLSVNTTLTALAGDGFATFGGGAKSLLYGIDYGLRSAAGNAGPGGQAVILDHVTFTLHLSGLSGDPIGFIDGHPVVAIFGSPSTPLPEPASFIVWFLIGVSWAGSAWTYRYRSRWQKWQQEETADDVRGHDHPERFSGPAGVVENHLDLGPASGAAVHKATPRSDR